MRKKKEIKIQKELVERDINGVKVKFEYRVDVDRPSQNYLFNLLIAYLREKYDISTRYNDYLTIGDLKKAIPIGRDDIIEDVEKVIYDICIELRELKYGRRLLRDNRPLQEQFVMHCMSVIHSDINEKYKNII
jgi:hypothetical protein